MEITIIFAVTSLLLLVLSIAFYLKNMQMKKDDNRLKDLEIENIKSSTLLLERDKRVSELQNKCEKLESERIALTEENTKIKSDFVNQKKYLDERIFDIERNKEDLALKFKDISTEIIKSQNKQTDEEHKKSLNIILDPLKIQLSDFKSKVEAVHNDSIKDKSSLDEQLKNLLNLNTNLTQEAQNLTDALRGNKKLQGNWGEIQLETILELSGLKKGINYSRQETYKNEENHFLRPDVIINLPNERKVIIDAKVSLNDYTNYIRSEKADEKKAFLKKHVECIKNHIDSLSSKDYQELLKHESLDYVVIFMPIESAFVDAISFDSNIYEYCFKKNIMIATPSSLLPILRTVENLWKIENQNKNVQEIAAVGGALYDKVALFREDMLKIGEKIEATRKIYDSSMMRLKDGRESIFQKALKLKKLGAKTSKNIPNEYEEEDIMLISKDDADV